MSRPAVRERQSETRIARNGTKTTTGEARTGIGGGGRRPKSRGQDCRGQWAGWQIARGKRTGTQRTESRKQGANRPEEEEENRGDKSRGQDFRGQQTRCQRAEVERTKWTVRRKTEDKNNDI